MKQIDKSYKKDKYMMWNILLMKSNMNLKMTYSEHNNTLSKHSQ